MNTQILFSDFDGTLYVNSVVSQDNREAVRRWRAAGRMFVMSTGRQWTDLLDHMTDEDVDFDYLLCLNGAECYDRNGQMLFQQTADGAMLPRLFELLLQGHGSANANLGERREQICAEDCPSPDLRRPRYTPERLATFSEFSQLCSCLTDMDAAVAARERVLAEFSGRVNPVVNGRCLDIVAPGVNKATGIARLLEHLGLDAKSAACVGDNHNDLCMLTAYRGYAMANAPEDVREQVHGTVESVAQLIDMLTENGIR